MGDIVRGIGDGKSYSSHAEAEAAAGAQLAGMQAAFNDSPAARIASETAALERLLNDPVFQDRKLRRDTSADYEEALVRTRLSAAKRDLENQPVVRSPDSELEVHGRQDLAHRGLTPDSVDQVIAGRAPAAETLATALARKAAALSDPNWVARWQSGGAAERDEMTLWNSTISLTPKESPLRSVVESAEHNMYFRHPVT
jgi:hypothetical protein